VYGDTLPNLDDGFQVHRKGEKICLLATGYMLHTAMKAAEKLAAEGISVGVIDLFDLSKFDTAKLNAVLAEYRGVATMEEGFSGRGGLDAMMFNHIVQDELKLAILNIGVTGGYRFEIGERQTLHEQVGIGVQAVVDKVSRFSQKL
jgi:transketolase